MQNLNCCYVGGQYQKLLLIILIVCIGVHTVVRMVLGVGWVLTCLPSVETCFVSLLGVAEER